MISSPFLYIFLWDTFTSHQLVLFHLWSFLGADFSSATNKRFTGAIIEFEKAANQWNISSKTFPYTRNPQIVLAYYQIPFWLLYPTYFINKYFVYLSNKSTFKTCCFHWLTTKSHKCLYWEVTVHYKTISIYKLCDFLPVIIFPWYLPVLNSTIIVWINYSFLFRSVIFFSFLFINLY